MPIPNSELAASLERSTAKLGLLVEKVDSLKTSNRTLRVIVSLLVVLVLVGVGFANWARVAAQDARHAAAISDTNAAAVGDLLNRYKAQTDLTLLIACQVRNSGNAVTRDQFTRQYDAFDALTTTPEGKAGVASLRDSLPTAASQDRDCNGDGTLSEADYQS